jgi:hypothetical protein
MSTPAIILGQPETVLRIGPCILLRAGEWEQGYSDTLAHFLQVQRQIGESSWFKSDCTYTVSGGKVTDRGFPDLESFVYAAVYFRQLCSERDHLFIDACDCYTRFVDSPAKVAWVNAERERFLSSWRKPGLHIKTHTTEELFHAFLYGAYLLHSIPMAREKHKNAFKAIIAGYSREQVQFELHGSLRQLFNHVANVAVVISQDFAQWVATGQVPKPDVMWHKSLFEAQKRT